MSKDAPERVYHVDGPGLSSGLQYVVPDMLMGYATTYIRLDFITAKLEGLEEECVESELRHKKLADTSSNIVYSSACAGEAIGMSKMIKLLATLRKEIEGK